MRFEEAFKKVFGVSADKFDKAQKDSISLDDLQALYEEGFDTGARAAKDYDPQWDAD